MSTDTITYKSYQIKIAQDQDAQNPFEDWDCEPPLLTYSGCRHGYTKAYNGAPETIREVLHLLPADTWTKAKRVEFLTQFLRPSYTWREIAECSREYDSLFDAVDELLSNGEGSKPEGWGSACIWFDLAEALLKWGGIPCSYEESNGHCQGDSTLCLVVLTPEWFKLSGCNPENSASICEATIELYSAWAWGDVYGVSDIIAPGSLDEDGDETEGEELEEGSCWGFYGSDHEKSGLMEHARSIIDCHIQDQKEEAETLEAALCSAE